MSIAEGNEIPGPSGAHRCRIIALMELGRENIISFARRLQQGVYQRPGSAENLPSRPLYVRSIQFLLRPCIQISEDLLRRWRLFRNVRCAIAPINLRIYQRPEEEWDSGEKIPFISTLRTVRFIAGSTLRAYPTYFPLR